MARQGFFRTLLLTVLITVACCYAFGAIQEKDLRLVQAQKQQVSATGTRWALLIGIEDYHDENIPDLQYSVDDVRTLASVLADQQRGDFSQVKLLVSDAQDESDLRTRKNILRALQRWLRQAKVEDTILVYFSGHGLTDKGGKNYLVPVDADRGMLADTAIRMERFNQILDDRQIVAAQRIVVVLDSCHSGSRVGQRGFAVTGAVLDPLFTHAEGRVTFASCGRDESSYEDKTLGHGVFTYYVTEGLKGGADEDRDGLIADGELFEYVASHVSHWARKNGAKQTPRQQRNVTGKFLLAYHAEQLNRIQQQQVANQEKLERYKRKLREMTNLPGDDLAKAENILKRFYAQEALTDVDKEWMGYVKDLADGKISLEVYLRLQRSLAAVHAGETASQTHTHQVKVKNPTITQVAAIN